MAGYTRQSAASIINGENITAPPINAQDTLMTVQRVMVLRLALPHLLVVSYLRLMVVWAAKTTMQQLPIQR